MRNVCAIFIAALLTTTAFAADSDASLAPGKPAGLRHAQDDSNDTVLYIVGLGAIAAGVVLLTEDNGSSNPPATTPSTQ